MTRLCFALVLVLSHWGCTEKPVTPPKTEPAPAADITAVPPPSGPAASGQAPTAESAAAVAATLVSPEFADMNKLVEFFYDRHQRVPTMAELTRSFGRPLPPTPPGYVYSIDPVAKKVKLISVK